MSRWLQAAKMARPPNDKIDLNDKNAGTWRLINSLPAVWYEPAKEKPSARPGQVEGM